MTQEDVSENFNRRWLIRLVTIMAIMFVGGLAIKSLFGNYFMARDAAFSYRQKTFSERAMAVHQDYLAGSRNGVACMKVYKPGGKSGSERICFAVSAATAEDSPQSKAGNGMDNSCTWPCVTSKNVPPIAIVTQITSMNCGHLRQVTAV